MNLLDGERIAAHRNWEGGAKWMLFEVELYHDMTKFSGLGRGQL